MFKIGFRLSKYVTEGLELRFFPKYATKFSFTEHQIISNLTVATIQRKAQLCIIQRAEIFRFSYVCYVAKLIFRNSFTFQLYRCKPSSFFYTTQKIRNLSLFSELGSYLICLYTTGPKYITCPLRYHLIFICHISYIYHGSKVIGLSKVKWPTLYI